MCESVNLGRFFRSGNVAQVSVLSVTVLVSRSPPPDGATRARRRRHVASPKQTGCCCCWFGADARQCRVAVCAVRHRATSAADASELSGVFLNGTGFLLFRVFCDREAVEFRGRSRRRCLGSSLLVPEQEPRRGPDWKRRRRCSGDDAAAAIKCEYNRLFMLGNLFYESRG